LWLEVKKRGQRPTIWQATIRITEFIKEGMHTSLQLHPRTNKTSIRTDTTPEKSKIKVRQMLTLVDYVPQPLHLLVQQWYKKHVTQPILFFNISEHHVCKIS
jgi:hypothetical protein